MTMNMQQAESPLNANQQVIAIDYRTVLQNSLSLLPAILIIPTPSGVNLIA